MLLLPVLLAGLAPPAAAQSAVVVPNDWPLIPLDTFGGRLFSGGDRFRLLFVTSTDRDATSTDIGVYNSLVQARAAAGHSAIRPYSARFRVVGSTAAVDARDNTGTTGAGVPIYWLGMDGDKAADDYADFYDGSWDNVRAKNELGNDISNFVWTGSNADGTASPRPLGATGLIRRGVLSSTQALSAALDHGSESYAFYALSPVFEVGPPVVSLRVFGDQTEVEEGQHVGFVLEVTPTQPSALKVAILVREEGAGFDNGGADPYPGHVAPAQRGTRVVEIPPGGTFVHLMPTVAQTVVEKDTKVHLLVLAPTGSVRSTVRGLPSSRGGGVELPVYATDGANMATVTVTDGSDTASAPRPEIKLTARRGQVSEGDAIEYWLAAKPHPVSDLEVKLNVEDGMGPPRLDGPECGRFLAEGEAGALTVTIPGSGSGVTRLGWKYRRFSVQTAEDGQRERDCSVVTTVVADSAYTVTGGMGRADVRVTDSGLSPGLFSLSTVDSDSAQDDSARNGCVPASLVADVEHRIRTNDAARWTRVLKALKEESGGIALAEVKTIHDRRKARGYSTAQWAPVVTALECLEGTPGGDPELSVIDGDPPGGTQQSPAVSVSAGNAVTEGGNASFTLSADPAPASDLAVTVRIAATGGVAAPSALGERTVTLAGGAASKTFSVATVDDAVDGPGGTVAATVVAGDGYTPNDGTVAAVAVSDDDATVATLSAPPGDVAEANGRKVLTVALGRALVQGEALTAPLVFSGAASPGSDYTLSAPATRPQGVAYADLAGPGTPALTFTGPSASSATLILTAAADSTAEGSGETVTAGLGTLSATGLDGGAEGSGSASFTILEPPPEIAIAATGGSITEGADAGFTVTASRAVGADLAVSLSVSEAAGSDFVAAGNEGAATVTIPQGGTEASFTVATVDDAADEPDGRVTVALAAGSGRYTVAAAPKDAASVAVSDNDAAATGPTVSVDDATAHENERHMRFTIRLSTASARPVQVYYRTRESTPVSARANRDYYQFQGEQGVRFAPGQTERDAYVYIFNDSHDEDPETFELLLTRAKGAPIADGVAVGTIVNSDPMPAAWLSRFGRTVAEQALDGIAGRMSATRTPGAEGAIAGQALSFGPGPGSGTANDNAAPAGPAGAGSVALSDLARGFGANDASLGADRFGTPGFGNAHGFGNGESRTMTARDLLLGSSFTATGETDATGGSLAFWGRAAQSRFDGREGTFSLDGEVTTGMLGADYARGRWMVGLALMQSSGEGGYADSGIDPRPASQTCPADEEGKVPCGGAVREGDGGIGSSLTAAIPYAAIRASERLKLWGAAGYGTGEVTLKPETGGSLKADLAWTMAAAGLRGDLLAPPAPGSGSGAGSGSGPALAVTSDALWARTTSEKTHELAASDSDVTRLRLGLEGSYRMALEGGGHVTPKLEVGARHDGGDAETGFGIELGGGIAWNDPALGLSLDVSGRTLIAHGDDDLKDRGYAASLAFDPDPATRRGPSLSLRQEFGGQARGGLDALFAPDPLEDRTGGGEATSRWAMEAAYGFPAFGGRFTGSPHVGLGLATGARDYTLGWRLTPAANANAPDVSFGLKATRSESDTAAPEHTVGFNITARW